jgi:tetratricopeptide (TPR) repeat protein
MRRSLALAFAFTVAGWGLAAAPAAAQESAAPMVHGAEVRVSSKKWDDALRFLQEEAIPAYPDNAELWYWLGVVYAQGKDRNTEEAAKAFSKANELVDPEETELKGKIDTALKALWGPLVNSAAKAADAGNLDESEKLLKQAVVMRPDGAEAYVNLGTIYVRQKKNSEAVEAYKKALELQPDNLTVQYNLGISYHELARASRDKGDPAKTTEYYKLAEATYKDYLAKKPGDADIINNLAALYQEQGDEAKMRATLGQVTTSETASAIDLYNAGLAALKGKEYAKAEEAFKKALSTVSQSDPEYAQVSSAGRENLGLALIQQKKHDEAIQVLNELLASNPDDETASTANEYLGFAYRESGRKEEAQAAFAKSEQLKKGGGGTGGQSGDASVSQ